MKRQFTPASKPLRTVFAIAAVIVTVAVLGGIDGLTEHYHAPTVRMAGVSATEDSPVRACAAHAGLAVVLDLT